MDLLDNNPCITKRKSSGMASSLLVTTDEGDIHFFPRNQMKGAEYQSSTGYLLLDYGFVVVVISGAGLWHLIKPLCVSGEVEEISALAKPADNDSPVWIDLIALTYAKDASARNQTANT